MVSNNDFDIASSKLHSFVRLSQRRVLVNQLQKLRIHDLGSRGIQVVTTIGKGQIRLDGRRQELDVILWHLDAVDGILVTL